MDKKRGLLIMVLAFAAAGCFQDPNNAVFDDSETPKEKVDGTEDGTGDRGTTDGDTGDRGTTDGDTGDRGTTDGGTDDHSTTDEDTADEKDSDDPPETTSTDTGTGTEPRSDSETTQDSETALDSGSSVGSDTFADSDSESADSTQTDDIPSDSGTDEDTQTKTTCADAPCDENADCDDSGEQVVCECRPGFDGDGKTCTDIDECTTGAYECGTNEECSNTSGDYTCVCKEGHTRYGEDCVYSRCDTTDLSQPETDCVRVSTDIELDDGCVLTRVNTNVDGSSRTETSTEFTCRLGAWVEGDSEVTTETCAGCEASKETAWSDSCGNTTAVSGACCLTTGHFPTGQCGSEVPEAWVRSGCRYEYTKISSGTSSVGYDWLEKKCDDGGWVLTDSGGDGGSCYSNCPEDSDVWNNHCGSQGDFEESCD